MAQNRVLSFHYTLKNSSGELLDSSEGRAPLAFIEGAGQIIPGLERALGSLSKGEKKRVEVAAADAYGERRESLVFSVPKTSLPTENVKVGDRFRGGSDDASPVLTVTSVGETQVTLDGNHPLAGQDLFFDVELTDVREATEEEMSHGHVHGEGGHSH
jgi:FKBP-type peptidyl-prolyl cis-trans isomerase SlyD